MPSPPAASEALRFWPQVGDPTRVRAHQVGHINDTYLVDSRFVLQRLNRAVFRNPQAVMRNLDKAVAHEGGRLLVTPIRTREGQPFAIDAADAVWRLFPRIDSRSFQTLADDLLEPAAAAFGSFLTTFADFPGTLEPVIAGFHDLPRYLEALDACPKGTDANDELRAVDALRGEFAPSAAQHVIHGDGKINNLLFHPTANKVVAIIDLDTIMFGDRAWDFGDLVRSAFIGGEEATDAPAFSPSRFQRLCRGFARTFHAIDDVSRFAAAPAYMSFMLAVRFLTDHLQGDLYFKVANRGDNLLRARSQLALTRAFRHVAPQMAETLWQEAQAAPAPPTPGAGLSPSPLR